MIMDMMMMNKTTTTKKNRHLNELRRAMAAIHLEVPFEVATDFKQRVNAALREAYMIGHSRQTNWESYCNAS